MSKPKKLTRTARLANKGLIHPPPWLPDNMMLEGLTGSFAYGCEDPKKADRDIVGIAIPPKTVIFPHLAGYIQGFGTQPPKFDQFQAHGIEAKDERKTYDIAIYNIVKFFQLAMENNPNMVEILFLPPRCLLSTSQIYDRMRQSRKAFLHKGAYHKFLGYAHSQLKKLDAESRTNPRRQSDIERFGYDTKFGYHLVRLSYECEMIMREGDIVLDRYKEIYKSIRRGEWTKEQLREFFDRKKAELDKLYDDKESPIPHKPDEDKIKALLLECLEIHYGSLNTTISKDVSVEALLDEIDLVTSKYRKQTEGKKES